MSESGRVRGREKGRDGGDGVKTYDTWGEGEHVSHWKMQGGWEGIKMGKENQGW